MAGETKVGLLAGLAFIVCFAIILANRGRRELVKTYLPYRVDSGANVQRAAGATASPPPSGQPQGTRRHDPPTADPEQPLTIPSKHRPKPTRVDGNAADDATTGAPTSGTEVVLGAQPGSVSGSASRRQTAESSQKRAVSQPPAGGTRSLDSSSPVAATNVTGNGTSMQPPSRSASVPTSSPGSVRYTVAKGDTLSKIATARYGSPSPKVITAIFEANRSVLSSPDLLPVGVELSLPVLDRFELTSVGNSSAKGQTTMPVRGSAFRWYQIKKNDRYISIAREQLGDARRWREIHELNKERFPDPHLIRDGVLIKLPGTSVRQASQSVGPTFQSVKRQARKPVPHTVQGARP